MKRQNFVTKAQIKLTVLTVLILTSSAIFAEDASHVLMIDRAESHFVYRLDGNIVPLHMLLDRIGDTLRQQSIKNPAKPPGPTPGFVLMVHADATISMIENARGLITKAGYDWPKIFYFHTDKRYMVEIVLSRGLRFSPQGRMQ